MLGLIMGLVVASKCVLSLDGLMPNATTDALSCCLCYLHEHASRRLWLSVPCLALLRNPGPVLAVDSSSADSYF